MRATISFLLLCLFFITACSDDDSSPVTPAQPVGNDALVVLVENNDMFSPLMSFAWASYKETLLPIFSDFFKVHEDSLKDKTLAEVIDDIAEPWMIDEMYAAAGNAYEHTVVLTDEDVTQARFVSEMETLHQQGCSIDVVFVLHASTSYICFTDADVNVSTLTEELKEKGIVIRALYQTCCYSSHHLPYWETTGITAACGSLSANYMVLFSPMGFLKSWTQGNNFTQAVADAYAYELEQTRAVDAKYSFPFGYGLEPSEENQASSRMLFCGTDTLTTIYSTNTASKYAYR